MARVGFIGTGEIASLMVHGLAGQGHEILVSDRKRPSGGAVGFGISRGQSRPQCSGGGGGGYRHPLSSGQGCRSGADRPAPSGRVSR